MHVSAILVRHGVDFTIEARVSVDRLGRVYDVGSVTVVGPTGRRGELREDWEHEAEDALREQARLELRAAGEP